MALVLRLGCLAVALASPSSAAGPDAGITQAEWMVYVARALHREADAPREAALTARHLERALAPDGAGEGCLPRVQPAGGWAPTEVLDCEGMARTILLGWGLHAHLPDDGAPRRLLVDDLTIVTGTARQVAVSRSEVDAWRDGREIRGLLAGATPLRVAFDVDSSREGPLVLKVRGTKLLGSTLETDTACRVAEDCFAPRDGKTMLLTLHARPGSHRVELVVAPGATLHAVEVVRKREAPDAVREAVGRLGLLSCAAGAPVVREEALVSEGMLARCAPATEAPRPAPVP